MSKMSWSFKTTINLVPGKEYALEEVAAVAAVAASVKLIDLHEIWLDMPEHADISDYLAHFGDEAFTTVQELIKNTPLWQPSPEQQTSTGFECFTAASLLSQYIEPPKYIVNSLLSEGLTVLAGPPKYGKSFLVLDLCCFVATGTPFLGFSTNQSKVLYLCLEDSKGRLKKRLQAVAQNNLMAQNLFFATNTLRCGLH